MSLKVVRLDIRHNIDLYKILVKNKDTGGLQLIQKKDIFLNSLFGGAIACIENDIVIKQVLLCEFKDNICFTKGLFGDFGQHTLEVLDILCATCSSNDPLIDEHEFIIQQSQIESFKALWPKTRLGIMATNQNWLGPIFKAKILYPNLF